MSNGTKVSVIIRAYNRGYIVGEAIESAFNQTYPDLEIVVVDDGSTDNTRDVVRAFRSDKIRYVRHETNRGVGAACNTGTASATGDLVAILDSDDLWKPDKLEKQVRFLEAHPETDAVFCDVEIQIGNEYVPSTTRLMRSFPAHLPHLQDGVEYGFSSRQMYLCLLEEIPIKTVAILMRKEALSKTGTFGETPSGEDWDFFLRMSRNSQFGYIDEALATQRVMGDATHKRYRDEDKMFLIKLFLKERHALRDDPEALGALNRGLASHYGSLAGNYITDGRRSRSFSTYVRGFKETREPMMLLRAASVFMPLGLRRALKTAMKGN